MQNEIEKMAKDVTRSICWCNEEIPTVDGMGTAITLYNKGYRKASEVAREIFEEIEKYVIKGISVGGEHLTLFNGKNYAELKKKYTEDGK